MDDSHRLVQKHRNMTLEQLKEYIQNNLRKDNTNLVKPK